MALRLKNTASGQEELFEPLGPVVKIYNCGLTPKNHPHLGHARHYVVHDTLRRYLEYLGYAVTYVQNFTDVDDKTIARGIAEGTDSFVVAKKYTDSYFDGMHALNVRDADSYPAVTKFIPEMIVMIEGLIAKGHAYEGGGNVYFDVASYPDYGKLSGRREEDEQARARIDAEPHKRAPRDFALWKAAKPGEPWWESPWGHGRPGWHIECSAMASTVLGEQIDIHGGGSDLIFPHHENEIAQSEAYSGKPPFARYWVHTSMLNISGNKMSHSLENFTTVQAVLQRYEPMALRLYLLSHHYRAPMDYHLDNIQPFAQGLLRLRTAREELQRVHRLPAPPDAAMADDRASAVATLASAQEQAENVFREAMDADLNTPAAIAGLYDLARAANGLTALCWDTVTPAERQAVARALAVINRQSDVLGLQLDAPSQAVDAELAARVEALIAERGRLRAAKDWAGADAIRQRLNAEFGVTLKDRPGGVDWEFHTSRG